MNVSTLLLGLTGGAVGVAYCTVPEFKGLVDRGYKKATELAEKFDNAKSDNGCKCKDSEGKCDGKAHG